MSIITVGTGDFKEVYPLSEAGMIFTSLLIVFSLIWMGLFVTALTKYLLEGHFSIYITEKNTRK